MSNPMDPSEVREHLSRILAQRKFSESPRICEFLRFVVEETLQGRSAELKEVSIGIEVYRKDPNRYDVRLDSTVRTEASRLRKMLESYYSDAGKSDSLILSIPKGGYIPSFARSGTAAIEPIPCDAPDPRAAPALQIRRRVIWTVTASLVITLAIAMAWAWAKDWGAKPRASMEFQTINGFLGTAVSPAISPGGFEIAFSWNGSDEKRFRIHRMPLNGKADPVPITKGGFSGDEFNPAFSRDRQWISFVGESREKQTLNLVRFEGGESRALREASGRRSAWSPLAAVSQYVVYRDRVQTHKAPVLTAYDIEHDRAAPLLELEPSRGCEDGFFDFSPDGLWFAYAQNCEVMAVQVDSSTWPPKAGTPRRLLPPALSIYGLTWFPDSRSLLVSAHQGDRVALWNVALSGDRKPVAIQGLGEIPEEPMLIPDSSGKGMSLLAVFAHTRLNIETVPLDSTPAEELAHIPASRWLDSSPQFDPAGTRVAFASNRSSFIGYDIFVYDARTKRTHLVPTSRSVYRGSPRWPPDGRDLIFDANSSGRYHLYRVDAGGGVPVRMSFSDSHSDYRPSYSRDGRWIYFGSDRSGAAEIWRMPASGGNPEQVTTTGAFESFPALGEDAIYFTKQSPTRGLWRLSDGKLTELKDDKGDTLGITAGRWAVTAAGILFVDFQGAEMHAPKPIRRYDLATRIVSTVAWAKGDTNKWMSGFAVDPLGRQALVLKVHRVESDFRLVREFLP